MIVPACRERYPMETRMFSVEMSDPAEAEARLRALAERAGWRVLEVTPVFDAASGDLARFLTLTAEGEEGAAFARVMRAAPEIADIVPETPAELIRPRPPGRERP